MLKVKLRVDLRGRYGAVPQQLLHRAQVAAALQDVAGKTVAQHVGVHMGGQAGLHGLLLEAGTQLVGCQARPSAADEEGRLVGFAGLNKKHALRQPRLQSRQRCAAHGHAAPLAALAQNMDRGVADVHPTGCAAAGNKVQRQQFTDAQTAAIKHLGNGVIACIQGSALRGLKI